MDPSYLGQSLGAIEEFLDDLLISADERGAPIYSFIETAKLNDVNPQAWLTDVLTRIPDHPIIKIDGLLSWKFGPVP